MNPLNRVPTNGGLEITKSIDLWNEQVEILQRRFSDAIEQVLMPENYPTDAPIVFVSRYHVIDVLDFVKSDPRLDYNFLSDLTASDELPETPRFHVIYNLYSLERRNRFRIKVKVPDGSSLPSAISLWSGANWAEREIFDMFGIPFQNHPDLRRILTHSTFEGHALRKDYDVGHYQIPSEAEPIRPELLE